MTSGADSQGSQGWLAQYYTDAKTPEGTRGAGRDSDPALGGLSVRPPDKYVAAKPIGSGGMKEVLRVRDKDAGRDVALALPRAKGGESRRYRRFVREGRITAALEHPNIVPIHDVGVDDSGRPYFTMRLLGGQTLEDILNKLRSGDGETLEEFTLHRLLDILLHVCRAIAFAHARGVVHRDLKPANIQVGDYGEVHVIDWGLAKVRDSAIVDVDAEQDKVLAESLDRTLDGVLKGSPGYMAPEQVDRRIGDIDERSDIYALGGLLYSVLTHKPPVRGRTLQQVLHNTRSGKVVPPHRRSGNQSVPPALEAVSMKALSRERSQRYESVDALADDIQAYLRGFATSAEDVGFARQAWLLVLRHRALSGVMAAALFVLAGLSVYTIATTRASERDAHASRLEAEKSNASA